MKKLFYIVSLVLFLSIVPKQAKAEEITIFPDSPSVSNCYPFGNGGVLGGDQWGPYMGFIYQNIPPFALAPGDIIAFDLGDINGSDVELDIELARTVSNGSTEPGQPFVKIVSNTQTPLNPNGDTIVGDFEMQFTVEAPFIFTGGGLIIRFSNPSASYALYDQCDQVLVGGFSDDTSGFFVLRFFNDSDGLPPYSGIGTSDIGAFRIVATGAFSNIPTLSEWGMIAAAAGLGLAGVWFAVRRRKAAVNS